MSTERTVLVTGATGQQGGAIARELLDHEFEVLAMTRKPDGDAARELAKLGARPVFGDLDDENSLRSALEGVWGTLAVQNTWEAGVEGEEEQGKRFARVAREAGVRHFVYQSVGSAHRDTGIPHFDNKDRVEEVVRSLGFESTVIFRPVFFMENLLSPWFKPAIDEGTLAMALEHDTRLQMIAVRDIGRFGVQGFTRADELNGREFELAGDALMMDEVARILTEVSGRTIAFDPPPIEAVREQSEEFAIMLEWFDRVGYDADIDALREEFGFEPQGFEAWAREHASAFRG